MDYVSPSRRIPVRGQDAPSYQVELEKFNTEADPNDMREPSPETSDLQIIADAVSDITKDGESRGNVDFLVLLLQELQSMPSITDDFRVRCLRFLREERKRMEWTSSVHSNQPNITTPVCGWPRGRRRMNIPPPMSMSISRTTTRSPFEVVSHHRS